MQIGTERDGLVPYSDYLSSHGYMPTRGGKSYCVIPAGTPVIFQDEDGNEISRRVFASCMIPTGANIANAPMTLPELAVAAVRRQGTDLATIMGGSTIRMFLVVVSRRTKLTRGSLVK